MSGSFPHSGELIRFLQDPADAAADNDRTAEQLPTWDNRRS